MTHHRRHRNVGRTSMLLIVALASATAIGVGIGCSSNKKKEIVPPRYPTLPLREVPAYLKDTILEKTDLADTGPFVVSGYGLVANLDNTGGGPYPTAVRSYMVKEMVRHGFGLKSNDQFAKVRPEEALDSKRFAIVEVRGFIPAGARRDQTFDIVVNTLPSSDAISLARGTLYQTDLHQLGLRETSPGGSVNVYSRAQGPVFVNPAYALNDKADLTSGGAKLSLRNGVILAGGRCMIDRPIRLQLRQPQRSTARQMEQRINTFFQNDADMPRTNEVAAYTVAMAQDEGIVHVYVPKKYQGDWEHFVGIVQHLYRNGSSEFSARQARVLADEAVKPGALLKDISFAWEGLGPPALPFIVPLMDTTKYEPDVTFAATRAAAFIGEPSAAEALLAMAKKPSHPFQLAAAQTLGAMPNTPGINRMLRELLDSPQTTVRVEAYKTLARNKDTIVYSKVVNEQFILDIVPSDGPPLIYATRGGLPRIALFGNRMSLTLPITFTALNSQFQIASDETNKIVNLFYRGREIGKPLSMPSRPDIAEIVARLGGEGEPGGRRFAFTYGDVVGLIQALSDQKKLTAVIGSGAQARRLPTSFVLQEASQIEDTIYAAPAIPGTGRPQQADPEGEPRAAGN